MASERTERANHRYTTTIILAFGRMVGRVVRAVHTEFTYEEVLELSAPPDVRNTLLKAMALMQPLDGRYSEMALKVPLEEVQFHFDKEYLMPKTPTWQGDDIRPELRDKFKEWLSVRTRVGIDYGRAKAVLDAILVLCRTKAQQRMAFPGILVVWQEEETMLKLVDQFAAFKPRMKLPPLPYALRTSLIPAITTLQIHGTLAGVQHNEPKVRVALARLPVPRKYEDEDGLSFEVL